VRSLLEQIRDEAVESARPIDDLLRKCLVLAYQLNHAELRDWARQELDGYEGDDVPEYRRAVGIIHGDFYDGYRQIRNAQIPGEAIPHQVREMVTNPRFVQPIGVIADLVAGSKSVLRITVPPEIAMAIRLFEGMECSGAWVEIPLSRAQGVIQAVRNKVLQFSLEILRSNPDAGRPDAAPVPAERLGQVFNQTIHVSGFVGNIGAGNSLNQNATTEIRQGDFVQLEQFLKSQGLTLTQTRELKTALEHDTEEAGRRSLGPRAKAWLNALRETGQATAAEIASRAIANFLGIPG
jgi:hypothetical protein